MEKPPFQFGLKAVFVAMTAVAIVFGTWQAGIFAFGVTLFLAASVLLVLLMAFCLCYSIARMMFRHDK